MNNQDKMRGVKPINNDHVSDSYEGMRPLMHTNRQGLVHTKPQANTSKQTCCNSPAAFKTKVLIIITHMHTNTEHGWAGDGEPWDSSERRPDTSAQLLLLLS